MPEDFRSSRRLRASAQPQSGYVRPAEHKRQPSSFDRLAKSLSDLNPAFQKYMLKRHEDEQQQYAAEAEKAYHEGEYDGIELNRQKWSDAISEAEKRDRKNGTSEADRLRGINPHFRRYYESARLRNMAVLYHDEMVKAWGENPEVELEDGTVANIHQSEDPRHMDQWQRQFTERFLQGNGLNEADPALLQKNFFPGMNQAQQQLNARHDEFRLQERNRKAQEEFSRSTSLVLNTAVSNEDLSTAAGLVNGEIQNAIKAGMKPRTALETVVDNVSSMALRERDPELMNVLDEIEAGSGPLGNVGWVQEARRQTEQAILEEDRSTARYREWERDVANENFSNSVGSQALNRLLEDPQANVKDLQQQLSNAGLPEAARSLTLMRESLLNADHKVRDDHGMVASITADILANGSPSRVIQDIRSGVQNGDLGGSTARSLLKDLYRQAEDSEGQSFISRPDVSGAASDVEQAVKDNFRGTMGSFTVGDPGVRALEAKNLFTREMVRWYREQGGDVTEMDILERSTEVQRMIFNSPRFKNENAMGEVTPHRSPNDYESRGYGDVTMNTPTTLLDSRPGEVDFSSPKQLMTREDWSFLIREHRFYESRGIERPSTLQQIAERHGFDADEYLNNTLRASFTGESSESTEE